MAEEVMSSGTESVLDKAFAAQVANPSPELSKAMGVTPPVQEEKQAEPPKEAVPAPLSTSPPASDPKPAPGLSPYLVQRAQEAGLTEADLSDLDPKAAERAVYAAERAQLVAFRRNASQTRQDAPESTTPPKPATEPPLPDFWAGKRDQMDPDFAAALDNTWKAINDHPAVKELRDLKAHVQYLAQHVQAQQRQEGEKVIDRVCDSLAKDGYADVLGDAKPKANTPQFRARYEQMNAYLTRAYEAGLVSSPEELDQMAKVAAVKFWGSRTPAAAPQPIPPAPERPRNPDGTFAQQPTPTARPSQRQAANGEPGFDQAVSAVQKILNKHNGRLPDLYDLPDPI